MGKIILITGGARCGKSSFAEDYVKTHGQDIAYIATSQIYDDEMAYRVKLHQQRRPSSWQTFEAPFHAEKAIHKAFCHHDIILFDCLTLYLSNYLCSEQTQAYSMEQLSAGAKDMMSALIEAVQAQKYR